MNKLLEGRALLLCLLLLFSLYVVVAGWGYGPNSRIFPLGIGLPTMALLGLALWEVWKPNILRWAQVTPGGSSSRARVPGTVDRDAAGAPASRVLRMLAWLVLVNVSIALVGFAITIPFYIALFMRAEGRCRWPLCVLAAALTWGFIVGYFELIMGMGLFKGILFGDLVPLF